MTVEKMIIGKIYTGDAENTIVSALGIVGNEIVFRGNEEEAQAYIGKETEVIRLEEGQLAMAGFMDGHNHLAANFASEKIVCKISEEAASTSYKMILEELSGFMKKNPNLPYYFGKNWMNVLFENGIPTSNLLDCLDTDKAVVVTDTGGHSFWCNSAALKLANITKDTKDPEGGKIERYEDGTPCGCFRDTAGFLILSALPILRPEDMVAGLYEAQELFESYGYTGFFDALTNRQATPEKYPCIQALQMIDEAGELEEYIQGSFVVNNEPNALEITKKGIELWKQTKGKQFEVSTIKIFMDGVIEGGTAYLSQPYESDQNNFGACRWSGEESKARLIDVIALANGEGMPCHFHAIGDAATTLVLDCLEEVQKRIGDKVKTVRNSITHLQVVDSKDMARFNELGVVACINPWGFKGEGMYKEVEEYHLGKERAEKEYPYQSFLKENVKVSFGTDWGCSFVADPIECFHVLTTRRFKNDDEASTLNVAERLSRMEAARCMTIDTAYQLHAEDRMGSLEVGKIANIIVLSKDLLTIADDEIMSTKVLKTMCNGKIVFEK